MQYKRVLVVDDQTAVRELVAAVLAADGHSVETARDGADALRLLDSAKPYDLIVSDLKMPSLDGPSLYLELTRRFPDTRPHLLFISGFVDSPEYSGFPVERSLEPSERQSLAGIRPDYAPTDRVDRIVYQPGDQVQCDL